MNKKFIVVSGKRKTAVSKAILKEGSGKVTINGRALKEVYFLDRLRLEEPLRIAKEVLGDELKFDISVKINGGGEKSQIEAARLAIARALVEATKSKVLKNEFLNYDRHLLVADVRRKEAYKPGDSKARRKRQKSYR